MEEWIRGWELGEEEHWKERREGKLQPRCKINKLLFLKRKEWF